MAGAERLDRFSFAVKHLVLRGADLTFTAFYEQARVGRGEMPSFSDRELPDGYLVHLWAWLMEAAD